MKNLFNRESLLLLGLVLMVVVAGIIAFSLKSNDRESPRDDVHRAADLINSKELYYVKDNRTDLCFAVHTFGWNSGLLSNVPCTDKVNRMLINQ